MAKKFYIIKMWTKELQTLEDTENGEAEIRSLPHVKFVTIITDQFSAVRSFQILEHT